MLCVTLGKLPGVGGICTHFLQMDTDAQEGPTWCLRSHSSWHQSWILNPSFLILGPGFSMLRHSHPALSLISKMTASEYRPFQLKIFNVHRKLPPCPHRSWCIAGPSRWCVCLCGSQPSPGPWESGLGFGELRPAHSHQEGGGYSLPQHLAGCPQNQARTAHEGWLGAQNSLSFPLNRHSLSVEILETFDLLQSISRVVREGGREVPCFL